MSQIIRSVCQSLSVFIFIAVISFVLIRFVLNSKEDPRKSVVSVLIDRGGGGTGVVINYNSKRMILTNAHICIQGHGSKLQIVQDNSTRYFVTQVKESNLTDLCIIYLPE